MLPGLGRACVGFMVNRLDSCSIGAYSSGRAVGSKAASSGVAGKQIPAVRAAYSCLSCAADRA